MSHYQANLRDLEFNLFEVFDTGKRLGSATVRADGRGHRARHPARAGEGGDRTDRLVVRRRRPQPAGVRPRRPSRPPCPSRSSSRTRCCATASGTAWNCPADLGGFGAPAGVRWAGAELLLGANPALFMYSGGPNFGTVVHRNGTQAQQKIADHMINKNWGSTMVLTEPDAGSDVGSGRTRAIRQPDGTWHLEGVKRFITSAEHDLTENIIHLVLARPEGPGIENRPGTKGLSLFIVPKYLFDLETGELGERNGVYVTGVEHKMGLKVSTTCEAVVRPARPTGGRIPARRSARRHRPDVPGHRVRPDDGRHQGDRHPVHRLPERPGVRQAAGTGRRPDPVRRQDRTAGDHHPPPGRAPDPDEAEGLRRGAAGGVPVHRGLAGPDHLRTRAATRQSPWPAR